MIEDRRPKKEDSQKKSRTTPQLNSTLISTSLTATPTHSFLNADEEFTTPHTSNPSLPSSYNGPGRGHGPFSGG